MSAVVPTPSFPATAPRAVPVAIALLMAGHALANGPSAASSGPAAATSASATLPANNDPSAPTPPASAVTTAAANIVLADSGNQQLDRVTVQGATVRQRLAGTSTKLPLTIRETPQSISTLDRDRLELESMTSINDVMQQITGVNVSFYDTQRPLYFARGFQITDFQVDGVPTYSNATNQEYDTAFYERIEVVRGANGLMTGAGVPSATVNMVRKRPQRSFGASVALSHGSWEQHRIEADLNVPLTSDGRVRARFVTAMQEKESYRDRYSESKVGFMGAIEADLGASTVLTLGYQDQNNVPKAPIWGTVPRFAADGSLADLPRSASYSPDWTRWSRQHGTAYAQLEHRLGTDWTIKAIANHSEGDSMSLRTYVSGFPDPTTGAGTYLLVAAGESWERRDSLDLYATGRLDLFGRRHDLVVGANGARTEATTMTLTSLASWRHDIPDIYHWDGSAPRPAYSRTGARRIATTEQTGVFASARWRLTDPLSLLTGVRVSQWETRTDGYNAAGTFTGRSGAYKVSDEITPYVGVVYDLTPQFSLYASYTDIFKPQNYKDKDNALLSPVKGSNAEAGVKAELLDKKLTMSLALFQAKQDNFAVRDSSQPEGSLPDGSSAYIGVDGTQSKGFEFDASGTLAPGWKLNAGYANTRITRHANDLIYANLPRHTLQLSTSYRLPGDWNRLTVGAGVNWQSKVTGYNIPHPQLGSVTVDQEAYALVNLFANWKLNEQLSLGLSVRNLFDKAYWANLDYPNYGDPRSVMVTLRGQF